MGAAPLRPAQISPTAAAMLRPGFAEIMQMALVGLTAVLVLELERCPKAVAERRGATMAIRSRRPLSSPIPSPFHPAANMS